MKKILILLFIFIFLINFRIVKAQNLVTNPSFEGRTWQVDADNTNFEDWETGRSKDNGYIRTWVETSNINSGSKALHWSTQAPDSTNISLNYGSNSSKKIPIDENNYIEVGLWAYVISGLTGTDISIQFYSADGTFLARLWGIDRLGELSYGIWSRVSYLWYPSSLGSGNGYIPAGAKYARIVIYCNWHSPGTLERIDDDVFVKQYNHKPEWKERLEKIFINNKLFADYNKFQNTSILFYSAHPTYEDAFLTGGRDQTAWNIIKQFNFSKMRFQSGSLFSSNVWFGHAICLLWNETANTCDKSNIWFRNIDISKNQDNGVIKTWIETTNVHSGSKAFRHYADAPSPTNLAFSYTTDYFLIDETKYYDGGFWSYGIQGSRAYDVTLLFYDKDKNYLSRRWGRDTLGSFQLNSWNRTSSLWYPSSLGQGNGYLESGAKYAKLNIYINWHVSGTRESIDDDIFVREFDHLPSTSERKSETASNLVSNPSFENSGAGYDWTTLDEMVEAIKSVSEEVIIAIPVGYWGNGNTLPDGFPLNESIPVEQWGNTGFFAAIDAYCQLVKDVINHTNKESGHYMKYWEIGNEPPTETDTYARAYMDLYNAAERCMHGIDPNSFIGSDRSDMRNFLDNYYIKYANRVDFLDFHNYDTGGTCMYPYNTSNVNNIYYPPNNQNGWMKDESIMLDVNKLSTSSVYSPKELKDVWKNKRGQDLEVINSELNMNSAWKNGSDPRMNDLLSAAWYAAKVKAYMLDGGASILNYFVIMSWDTDSPTAKYGGFGFGMMNSSYPYSPYAPYWTNYFMTKFFPKGSSIYYSKSSDSDIVDLLSVKTSSSNNILLINKFNETVNFTLPIIGFTIKNANLYFLDKTTYIQRYEPSLDNTVIYKSTISTIPLPKDNVQTFTFNGYTVAVIEAFPDTSAPYLVNLSSGLDLKSATWNQNKYDIKTDCAGDSTIQIHSDTKPPTIKKDGIAIAYDDSLTTIPSWKYDANGKLITVKFYC